MRKRKQKIKVRSNLPNIAKYLLTNELKIFSIFDYEEREKIGKRGSDDTKNTYKSKTIRTSSKGF